ncbi:MFS transporter [Amycolatopsis sp. NPDC051371]|uniref:MFS transporter n=1 Tax=Amycolatopsis sp. NPDC051371 TaxID=3155800 RepID=UPI00343BF9B0
MTAPAAWAPLRRKMYRTLWIAQFAGNVGTWAQTVGAQWLMGDLGGSALDVSLVQTAMTLPVFLLVVPAGALGDIFDRRRLLLTGQTVMLAGAAALAAVTAAHQVSPGSLLALTATMALGQALSVPSFQAIQPELVPRSEIAQAALLNSANANIARAVGPALGGVLIAALGAEATFALNAVSFLGVLAVVFTWRRERADRPLGAERLLAATRAGARYVRSAPAFATVLARSASFMLFAGGLWSLLPAVARGPLHLGAGGYGLLLACLGAGAVTAAVVLPSLRAVLGTNTVIAAGTVLYGLADLVTGLTGSVPAVVVALFLAGVAWIAVLSTLNSAAQLLLPAWTRARALAYYQLVFMGGQALGALLWGFVADLAGLAVAFAVPGAGLVVAALVSGRALRLPDSTYELGRTRYWPEPPEVATVSGPVQVQVEWRVTTQRAHEFERAMQPVGWARRRSGATRWRLHRDLDDPELFVEQFVVASWQEHLRQHYERSTELDRQLDQRVRALTATGDPPRVRHLEQTVLPRRDRRILGRSPE